MSQNRALFLSLFLFPFSALNAQSHFLPGKIVPNTGDTVSGQIDYGNWMLNPRTIQFRSGPGTATSTYTVSDLMYFEVTGRDIYTRASVQEDMRPLAEVGYTSTTDIVLKPSVRDTVFLRLLITGGPLSLYELVDSKAHYYISDRPGTYTELQYALLLSQDGSRVNEIDQFKFQLKAYLPAAGSRDVERMIDRAGYNEDDLKETVLALDGSTKGGAVATEVAHTQSIVPRFYAAVGAGVGKFALSGSMANSGLSMGIYGGMDLIRTRNNGDLALRFQLGYSSVSYKGHGTLYYMNYTYTLDASTITPSVSAIYYFYRADRLRLYAGAGFLFNLSTYSGGRFYFYEQGVPNPEVFSLQPQSSWYQFQLKVGAQVANRFSLELFGGIPAEDNPYLTLFSTNASISQLGLRVGYFFNGTH